MGKNPRKEKKPVSKGKKIARIIGIIIGVALLITIAMCVKVFATESEAQHSLAEYQEMYSTVSIEQLDDETVVTSPIGNSRNTGIIFYVGAQITPEAYTPVMAELAELGYTCWIPKMTCNFPALSPKAADDIMQANPDIESWFIGGHSMGGLTASGYAAEHLDDFDGLFFLAAWTNEDLSETDLPVLSLYGSNDAVLSMGSYEKAAEKNPADYQEIVIEGANHGHFGDYGEQLHDNLATITSIEQWEETAELLDDWITSHQ